MNKMPGKLRTYSMELVHPTPTACNDFQQYTREQIEGRRKLLRFTPSKTASDCIVELEMQCWSCGRNSPNNFTRDLFIKYPDVTIKNFKRHRNNDRISQN
jgi:hypothetical protein